MLFRFLKHQTTDWAEDGSSHGWYTTGDVVVGRILKTDHEGIWLMVHSDDDMIVIVEADSFEVIEGECWGGEPPKQCERCTKPLALNIFFWAGDIGQVMCHGCWLDGQHHASELSQRYELDKSDWGWVRTR